MVNIVVFVVFSSVIVIVGNEEDFVCSTKLATTSLMKSCIIDLQIFIIDLHLDNFWIINKLTY